MKKTELFFSFFVRDRRADRSGHDRLYRFSGALDGWIARHRH